MILILLAGYHNMRIIRLAYILNQYKRIVEGLAVSKRSPAERHKVTGCMERSCSRWGGDEQSSPPFRSCWTLPCWTQGQLLISINKAWALRCFSLEGMDKDWYTFSSVPFLSFIQIFHILQTQNEIQSKVDILVPTTQAAFRLSATQARDY